MSAPETELVTSPPAELEHTKLPGYVPMDPLPHTQLQDKPTSYANLSDK